MEKIFYSIQKSEFGVGRLRFFNEMDDFLGYCSIRRDIGDAYKLSSLMVFPEFRNRGYARGFIEFCFIAFKPKRIYLSAVESKRVFYEKLGFTFLSDASFSQAECYTENFDFRGAFEFEKINIFKANRMQSLEKNDLRVRAIGNLI